MKTITIDPVTRIEGHARITIQLDDQGRVADAKFHVTQFRGFEKLCEGRPFYEMPSLMARTCGICPVSHLVASAKACDAILAVRIPETAANLRRVLNLAQIVQSHALSFHNKEASGIPSFTELEGLKAYTAQDEGATFASLTRVSHVHMFGISFIFMFVGLIFSFAETTTTQYKCIAIGMPYFFLVADIMSWWLTKIHPWFAWLVIFAGMGMGISFMFMWVTSILEMWLFKPVFINGLGSRYLQWRDSPEASIADRIWVVMKALASQVKPAVAFVTELWLKHAWPVIKDLFKK